MFSLSLCKKNAGDNNNNDKNPLSRLKARRRLTVHETIRVKSAAWDAGGNALLYSTLNHVKYALPTGRRGGQDAGRAAVPAGRGGEGEFFLIFSSSFFFPPGPSGHNYNGPKVAKFLVG